jgi:PST family polysaccharide transporter
MLAGFLAGKFIAIHGGPVGISVVGVFQNLITIIQSISTAAMSTGVVKYTAEFNSSYREISLFSTVAKIFTFFSFIIAVLLVLFSSNVVQIFDLTDEFKNPVIFLGISIFAFSFNTLISSILNGKKEIKIYTLSNAISSVISLILTVILVNIFDVIGAIYSIVLTQVITSLFTYILVYKFEWFKIANFTQPFDNKIFNSLLQYTLMGIVTSLSVPVVQLITRNIILENVGVTESGLWQGVTRISDSYLIIVNTVLSTYYLPQLSSINDNKLIRGEIIKGLKIILPFVIISCSIIYFSRFFIIGLFYSEAFYKMENLFTFQLIGDVIRVVSWQISYIILAKSLTKIFIFSECVNAILSISLTYIFVNRFGLIGVTYSFALNSMIYLMCISYLLRNFLFKRYFIDDIV